MATRRRIWKWLPEFQGWGSRAYGAVFAGAVTVAPVVPVAAALATVGIYIMRTARWPTEQAILVAMLAALVAWFAGALLVSGHTKVTTSNPRVYLNLIGLAGRLEASLQQLHDEFETDPARSRVVSRLEQELAVVRRILSVQSPSESVAEGHEYIEAQAEPFFKRRDWPLGTAYNELYRRLHAIETDLLLICGRAELLTGAIEDHFRLNGSNVAQRDSWQYQLDVGVAAFGEDPRTFFERPPGVLPTPDQTSAPPDQERVAPAIAASRTSPETLKDARLRLRSVHATVIDYRDSLFEGIVRQRLRTMWMLFATGCGVYLVVVLAVLHPTNREHMFGATVLFLVGALIGLFNRLAANSEKSTEVEDYGLSTVRLLQTIVLSGIAAVLGVVVTAYGVTATANSDVLPGLAPTPTVIVTPSGTPTSPTAQSPSVPAPSPPGQKVETPQLGRLFELETYPFAILLAAIFGLTPQLLLGRLEAASRQLKLDIKSVEK